MEMPCLRRLYKEFLKITPRGIFRAKKSEIESLGQYNIEPLSLEDITYLRSIPDLPIHTDFDPDRDTTDYHGKAMTLRQYYSLTKTDIIDTWLYFEKWHQ